MDVTSANSGADMKLTAAIYSQNKAEEVQENQVMQAMQSLDENMQKQVEQEVATITGRGGNLNIQG
jgi:hypothetical protein